MTLLSFTFLAGLGILVGGQITQLASDLPQYQAGVEEKITAVRAATVNSALVRGVASLFHGVDRQISRPEETNQSPANVPIVAPNKPVSAPQPVILREPEPHPYEIASRIVGPIIQPIATAGIVVIFVIFILLQRSDLRDRLLWFAGTRDLRRTTNALNDAAGRLARYFLVQTAINAAFGVLLGAGLWLIGVPNFLVWGALASILRFLPYIGGLLSAILPLALAAAVDPGWSKVLWTAGLFAGLELITGQIIEPLLFGRTTGMSPLAVVVAAAFWTWLWGPVGLLLSTPLTLLLVVLGQHVERFNFLAILFGDAPPLSPEESFYHRVLSGSVDEATDEAFALLKEKSRIAYYDEVALPGLARLQLDLRSGLLPEDELAKVGATIGEILDVVGDYDEIEPDPSGSTEVGVTSPAFSSKQENMSPRWRSTAPVLCIAGRSTLDLSAAKMLQQLLERRGIGTRIVSISAVSTTQIFKLDMEGVALICLSYLAPDRPPSHTRYLIQRLRRRIGDTKVLAGFWTSESVLDAAASARLKSESGADLIATTFEQAVALCLREATDDHNAELSETATLDARRSA